MIWEYPDTILSSLFKEGSEILPSALNTKLHINNMKECNYTENAVSTKNVRSYMYLC